MCVSVDEAEFSGTKIFVNRTYHPMTGQRIFVVGYENIAENRSDGPNAMILHFPSRVPMSEKNFLDTTECRSILKDMHDAVQPRMRGIVSKGASLGIGDDEEVQIFEHDIYTVVLGPAKNIAAALDRVPAHKRPKLNPELFAFYAEAYPEYSVALCCFDNAEAAQAAPLLVWYEQMNSNAFLAPAIDCHTGRVPDLRNLVYVEHWIFLSADEMRGGHPVHYSDHIPVNLRPFLPTHVVGKYFNGRMKNGDFIFAATDVMSGNMPEAGRFLPPHVRQ